MKISFNNINLRNDSLFKQSSDLEPEQDLVWFNKKSRSKEISLKGLVNLIENNNILNYPYDFLSLDGSNNKIPNIITLNLVDNVNNIMDNEVFEHYDRNTGQITITENLLYSNSFMPTNFQQHLYKAVGRSKLLNYAILHEIGHAIHHQLYLKQNKNYLIIPQEFEENTLLNLIASNPVYLLGKDRKNDKYDINHAISYSIKEGFADLFACIGLTEVYSKEVADSFINEVIDARKTNYDYYYVVESLEQLKIDNQQNKLNFSNFDSLHFYINDTIANTALKTMLTKLDSQDTHQIQHNNAFAGHLKALLQKTYNTEFFNNINSVKEMVNCLDLNKNNFNIKLKNLEENKDMFMFGYSTTISNNTTKQNFLSSKMKLDNIREKINNIRTCSLKSQNKTLSF